MWFAPETQHYRKLIVLPSLRDLYRIVLHPNRLTLERVRKGCFSKAEAISATIEIEETAALSWQPAIAHLDALIDGIKSFRADVEVVLSNHFVRYAVVPWSNESMNASEDQAMTRFCFEETYGDLAEGWDIRLSGAAFGEPRLASAVDLELIQALAGVIAATSLRLVSVQPLLMASFNCLQKQVQDEDYLFMLGERGRLCITRIKGKRWSHVRLCAVNDLAAELPALVNREVLLAGFKPAVKKYYLDTGMADKEAPLPGVQVLSLPEASSGSRPGLLSGNAASLLQLDYLPRHWAAYRAGMIILVAAIAASAYVMGSTVLTTSEVKSQESQWQNTRLAGHGSGAKFQTNADKVERLKPELKRANEVVRQLALPWDGLFKAIEVFDPNQVALLRIETDVSRRAVTIAAESESFEAMLGYIESLGKRSALTEVYLIDHQIQEHDPQRPVRFTVSAVWLGDKW